MVTNRHIEKIIAVIMALAVLLCFVMMLFSDKLVSAAETKGISLEYESKLFDTDNVMEINILIDDNEWQEMLDNAINEEYIQCDIQINGTTFYNTALRPKGNTSLSSIAMDSDTDRYSFKIEFDRYAEGQTCFGLDKLILNNNYADATNMKEALVYDMYKYIGADASLYNFAKISVNGEYWGVYLALEAVEESFMLRNYGTEDGKLYKPENMGMGKGGNMQMPDMNNSEMPDFDNMQMPDMNNSEKPDFGKAGGFGKMGGGGSNLNYSGDDLNNYSAIWESAVTNTDTADHKRVVKALKNISEGNDLEKYMDIDNILKYMAVHVFSVNEDSLSGMMAHNYYLYEHDGRLNILPWDYNLILGGMGMKNNASSTINDPIDTPFSATQFFDKLLENEEYLEKYHEYLQMLTEKYIDGGGFDEFYERTRRQIDELVSADPTAFYSKDEYKAAASMLHDVVILRSNSVQGQLNGSVPSTENGQRVNAASLVNTDDIDLSIMGAMDMGNGGMQPPNNGQIPDFNNGEKPDFGNMPDGFQPPDDGQIPDFNNGEKPDFGNMPDGFQPPQNNTVSDSEELSSSDRPSFNGKGQNKFSPDAGGNNSSNVRTNLIMTAVSFGLLIIAIIIAKLYRRKNIRK